MAESITYGMTPNGFVSKRLTDIMASINHNLAQIPDPATGERMFQNPSDDSFLQQIVGVFAEGLSECWQAAYDASVQFDPLENSGSGQAGTIQLNAMLAKPGTRTILEMALGGKPGIDIPKGSRVSSPDGKQTYVTLEDVTLDDGGAARVRAECTVKGTFDPKPNTIVQIGSTQNGWLSAHNMQTDSVGTPSETGEEIRKRQQRSTSLTSFRQIDAVYAAIRNIPGVNYCRVYQNDRFNPFDSRGIPFKEVAAVVEGGDPSTIVDALWHRLPVGVIGYGNTAMTRHDQQCVSYSISFSRPVNVPIFMKIVLEVVNRAEFPATYAQSVAHEITEYARYGGEGNEEGFPPGADIVRSRLYTPINRIGGHRIVSVSLGVRQGQLAEVDIPIAWNKVGRFAMEQIEVACLFKEDTD